MQALVGVLFSATTESHLISSKSRYQGIFLSSFFSLSLSFSSDCNPKRDQYPDYKIDFIRKTIANCLVLGFLSIETWSICIVIVFVLFSKKKKCKKTNEETHKNGIKWSDYWCSFFSQLFKSIRNRWSFFFSGFVSIWMMQLDLYGTFPICNWMNEWWVFILSQ